VTRRLLSAIIASLFFLPVAYAQDFRGVTPGYTLAFPLDFYFKDGYRLQWWYFTGHLYDDAGREFGYELTFFAAGLQRRQYKSAFGVRNIYISHFAISDVNAGRHYTSDYSDTGAYGFSGAESDRLRVWVDDNVLEGSVSNMHLRASDKDRTLDLILSPEKPLVLNGEKGYSRKSEDSPDIASWYFSFTDLKTEGRLSTGGKTFRVSGKSWFDREISSGKMGKNQKGWDWFSIQLDDGREVMLYMMRKADGSTDRYSSGTFVYKDGRYRHLSLNDFKIKVMGHFNSKKTGAVYPAQWEILVPSEGLSLRITPLIADQEFIAAYSTGNHYWEGTCKVEGSAAGRAYVELTGY